MSVSTPHIFETGDRVKAAADLGWLKLDSTGLVTRVVPGGSADPDARPAGDTVMVVWTDLKGGEDFEKWDGDILGLGSVDLQQFRSRPEIPMYPIELRFIDNLLKKD